MFYFLRIKKTEEKDIIEAFQQNYINQKRIQKLNVDELLWQNVPSGCLIFGEDENYMYGISFSEGLPKENETEKIKVGATFGSWEEDTDNKISAFIKQFYNISNQQDFILLEKNNRYFKQ